MKRLFSILLVFLAIVVAGASAYVPVAVAQGAAPCDVNQGPCQPAAPSVDPTAPDLDTAARLGTSAAGTAGTADDQYGWVMVKIMSLFAWLLGVAAITLDNVVYYTVVKMGSVVNDIDAIGFTWRILRDIGNIALIFGFLAIGLSIILNSDLYGWSKNLLPKLLIVAVAMNFSLFVAEAVIDAGNLFATQFYMQINGGNPAEPTGYSADLYFRTVGNGQVTREGISNKIMGQLGMQTIYGGAITNNLVLKANNQFFIGFMGIILFTVTAFVMFALSFMLVARFIALVFVIILAPIGFAGFAIPQLEGIARQWRSALIDQTITAPIMLLMLYVALAVITDVNFLTGFCETSKTSSNPGCRPDWLGFVGGNFDGFASMMLSFLVAMGLLLAVVVLSKKLGAFGSAWATRSAGRVVGGFVGYGIAGGLSLAGRTAIGLPARALNSQRMQAWASKGGVGGTFAKVGAFTGRKLENRTFDLRNSKIASGAGRAVTGSLGNIAGHDTGFNAVAAGTGKGASVTAKTAVDKGIEGLKYIKPTSGDLWRNQQMEYEKAATQVDLEEELASGEQPRVKNALKKMSEDEIAALPEIRGAKPQFVAALSPTKYTAVQKSTKLLKSEKVALKKAWEDQFNTMESSKAALNSMDDQERVALGGEILSKSNVYKNLNADDLDNIRSAKLKPDEKETIAAYVRGIAAGVFAPGSAEAKLQVDVIASAENPKFRGYYSIPRPANPVQAAATPDPEAASTQQTV